MYTVCVRGEFTSFHFLTVPDAGRERRRHAHRYAVSARFEGYVLDGSGYLIDIRQAERALGFVIRRFRNKTLNELPEFKGLNPSIEHFARIIFAAVSARLRAPRVHALTVTVAESKQSHASFRGLSAVRDGGGVLHHAHRVYH